MFSLRCAVLPASGVRRVDCSPEKTCACVNLRVVFNGTRSAGLVEPALPPHGGGVFPHKSIKLSLVLLLAEEIVYCLVNAVRSRDVDN